MKISDGKIGPSPEPLLVRLGAGILSMNSQVAELTNKQQINDITMRKYLLFSILSLCIASSYAEDVSIDDLYPPTNNKNVQVEETNLPIVFINTLGSVIQREDRITARMKIIDNGAGSVNHGDTIAYPDQTVDYEGYIGLKYRGNSSFEKSDKKPYGLHSNRPSRRGERSRRCRCSEWPRTTTGCCWLRLPTSR